MNNQEYEQKKHECWKALCKELLKDEVQWEPVSRKDVFNFTFDRAYALGKQKETITQEDVEKAAEKYNDQHTEKLIHNMHNNSTSWEPLQDGIRNAFLAGVNFALGKQAKDEDDAMSQELFGSKCLPDESAKDSQSPAKETASKEPKPAGPNKETDKMIYENLY